MSIEFFKSRRSVRSFSDRPIEISKLNTMIDAAAHAPNTGNMQTVCAVVTTDPRLKSRLAPCHFNQPCVERAAAVVTFCADFNRFNRWCHLSGATPGLDNLQSLLAGIIDASIFAQQFCTIAEMDGLGTVDLGTTLYNADQIADILSLPKAVVPVITVAVGHPAADAAAGPTDRLPLEAVLHHDTYKDFSDDDIHRIYAQLESEPSSKQFVKENNKESLAQVFTDIRYPKSTSDTFSASLRDFLKRQGFE